jgi:hypothetical protein
METRLQTEIRFFINTNYSDMLSKEDRMLLREWAEKLYITSHYDDYTEEYVKFITQYDGWLRAIRSPIEREIAKFLQVHFLSITS